MSKCAEQIVWACRRAEKLRFVAALDGNISARLEDGSILTTPTGIPKGEVTEDCLVKVSPSGEILAAPQGYRPSSEIKLHIECYRQRADAFAVVHMHPIYATAFAVSRRKIPASAATDAAILLGEIPVAEFALPSTDELPESISKLILNHDGILLANHGALTVGCDVRTAFFRMDTLEHWAEVYMKALSIGGPCDIEPHNLERLLALRDSYGISGKNPLVDNI